MKKKHHIAILFISCFISLYSNYTTAQVDADSLMGLPTATTAELENITTPAPAIGSVAFDTTKDALVKYTSDGWKEVIAKSYVYNGFFIINPPATAGTPFDVTINNIPFKPSQIKFVAHANVESIDLELDSNGLGDSFDNDRGIVNSFGTMHGFARDNGTPNADQQVIYVGGHGNSINDISRFASSTNCIGIRYGNQDGNLLGKITGNLNTFNTDGFSLNITYTLGDVTVNSANALVDVQPEDILTEGLVVLFTAYK